MEQLGLERTSKPTQLQHPSVGGATTRQGPIQPGLELLQGWGIHGFSGLRKKDEDGINESILAVCYLSLSVYVPG